MVELGGVGTYICIANVRKENGVFIQCSFLQSRVFIAVAEFVFSFEVSFPFTQIFLIFLFKYDQRKRELYKYLPNVRSNIPFSFRRSDIRRGRPVGGLAREL